MQGAGRPWGWNRSSGNLASRPSGPRSSVLLLPGSWAGQPQPSEVAMGQANVPEGAAGLRPAQGQLEGQKDGTGWGWQRGLILSLLPPLCDRPVLPRQGWAGGGSPTKGRCPQPPKVPRAPSSTSALPRTLPRAQQRDAKSHHANYANRINYSCYSEGSPESSLAL